jgi:hypothetical protein
MFAFICLRLESLHLPLSLYFLYFLLYFDIFVFISLVIHGRLNKGQSQYPQMPNIIITENGINKLLQNINIHKASGPDNIHGRILKECTTQIAPILTTLFSLSLKTGKIPDDWRYASVCPAFKKGDKNNPINYRP